MAARHGRGARLKRGLLKMRVAFSTLWIATSMETRRETTMPSDAKIAVDGILTTAHVPTDKSPPLSARSVVTADGTAGMERMAPRRSASETGGKAAQCAAYLNVGLESFVCVVFGDPRLLRVMLDDGAHMMVPVAGPCPELCPPTTAAPALERFRAAHSAAGVHGVHGLQARGHGCAPTFVDMTNFMNWCRYADGEKEVPQFSKSLWQPAGSTASTGRHNCHESKETGELLCLHTYWYENYNRPQAWAIWARVQLGRSFDWLVSCVVANSRCSPVSRVFGLSECWMLLRASVQVAQFRRSSGLYPSCYGSDYVVDRDNALRGSARSACEGRPLARDSLTAFPPSDPGLPCLCRRRLWLAATVVPDCEGARWNGVARGVRACRRQG